jgi:hypothetical protein
MLFTADAHPGLASGAITLTFRVWARPQVKVGRRYRVGSRHQKTEIWLQVDSVEQVRIDAINATEAVRSGHPDRRGLVAALRRRDPDLDEATVVYRIAFHRVPAPPEPDPSKVDDLTSEDVELIRRRLERLERHRSAWTLAVLRLIRDQPGVVSTSLAAQIEQERFAFKDDVRRLKKIGLTESLPVGYRLSPRGEAFLRHRDG